MSNMEDYNDASAMAAPGTHQLSAGLEIIALHKETVQALICTGTIQCVYLCVCVCVFVCMCVIKNIRLDEKTHKNDFQFHKCKRKGALSLFIVNINPVLFFKIVVQA